MRLERERMHHGARIEFVDKQMSFILQGGEQKQQWSGFIQQAVSRR